MENHNKASVHPLVEIRLSFRLEAAPLEQKFISIVSIGSEPRFHYFHRTSESSVNNGGFLYHSQ